METTTKINNTDPKILSELRKYKKTAKVLCIQCGYDGLMGFKNSKVPWYLSYWVLIPICFTGIGIIPAILLGIWREFSKREHYVCPNCDSILET
jgi:hypothetical protein